MKKALVIETGEILDVIKINRKYELRISIPEELRPVLGNLPTKSVSMPCGEDELGAEIELSDGNLYKRIELIIGKDDIRDYKIKNITK